MEEILESIANGQRKQAIEQLKESGYTLEDLIDSLKCIGDYEEMVTMVIIAFNTGYIKSDFE